MTARYVFALSAVALIVATAWASLQSVIHANQASGQIINRAGRQRMLCQRLALLSYEPWSAEGDIEAAVQTMRAANRWLLGDKPGNWVPKLLGPNAFGEAQELRADVERFVDAPRTAT